MGWEDGPSLCSHPYFNVMITTEIPVKIGLPEPKNPRSPGIHVSNLIRCIATESGILDAKWAEELSLVDVRQISDPVAILRISIGLAWEDFYVNLLEDVADHPGEMELDGIYMTHDGESVSVIATEGKKQMVTVCHEFKATYKSTNTVGDLKTQWMWLTQVKAYCKALRTRHAMLHVLFLCGDYKYPISPQLKVWQVEFTQEEIDDNWTLLTEYRNYRLSLEQSSLEGI
jgi:hypothetical protein